MGEVTTLPLPVDQDSGRVLLWGVRLHTFACPSNAARACEALQTLVDLGLLTRKGVVPGMLRASVESMS